MSTWEIRFKVTDTVADVEAITITVRAVTKREAIELARPWSQPAVTELESIREV